MYIYSILIIYAAIMPTAVSVADARDAYILYTYCTLRLIYTIHMDRYIFSRSVLKP